jgi:hypothetical protein
VIRATVFGMGGRVLVFRPFIDTIGIIIAAHERDYVGPKQASSTGWANGAI